MMADWTPTHVDPARRLFQVRQALEVLHLPAEHREGMAELATNLERKFSENNSPRLRRVERK